VTVSDPQPGTNGDIPTNGAPAPSLDPPGIPGVKDGFLAVNSDLINFLYGGLSLRGAFQADCVAAPAGFTFGDLFPADCSTLTQNTDIGHCHAAKGDDCTALGNAAQKLACTTGLNSLQQRSITPDTPLLFCGRQDAPPHLSLQDDPGTPGVVEAQLRFPKFVMRVVLDRDPNNPGTPGAPLATMPGCFSQSATSTTDCSWGGVRCEIDAKTALTLDTTGDSPKLVSQINTDPNSITSVCAKDAGGVNFGDSGLFQGLPVTIPAQAIISVLNDLSPEFKALGLDLGGKIGFTNPTLLAIRTSPAGQPADCPTCQDYVGVTGTFAPVPAQPVTCP